MDELTLHQSERSLYNVHSSVVNVLYHGGSPSLALTRVHCCSFIIQSTDKYSLYDNGAHVFTFQHQVYMSTYHEKISDWTVTVPLFDLPKYRTTGGLRVDEDVDPDCVGGEHADTHCLLFPASSCPLLDRSFEERMQQRQRKRRRNFLSQDVSSPVLSQSAARVCLTATGPPGGYTDQWQRWATDDKKLYTSRIYSQECINHTDFDEV